MDVFCYLSYEKNWTPRAIFVPIQFLKDDLENLNDIINENNGVIFENRLTDYKKKYENYELGYNTKFNTQSVVKLNKQLFCEMENDCTCEKCEKSLYYWIKDLDFENCYDLRNIILNMKEHKSVKINVINCLIHTDFPIEQKIKKMKRFFIINGNKNKEEIMKSFGNEIMYEDGQEYGFMIMEKEILKVDNYEIQFL